MSNRESPLASPLYPQYHAQRPLPHFSPRTTPGTRTSPRVSNGTGSIRSSPVITPLRTADTYSPHHFATLSPTTRQTTRALQEIHAQMGFLTPNGERGGGGAQSKLFFPTFSKIFNCFLPMAISFVFKIIKGPLTISCTLGLDKSEISCEMFA